MTFTSMVNINKSTHPTTWSGEKESFIDGQSAESQALMWGFHEWYRKMGGGCGRMIEWGSVLVVVVRGCKQD